MVDHTCRELRHRIHDALRHYPHEQGGPGSRHHHNRHGHARSHEAEKVSGSVTPTTVPFPTTVADLRVGLSRAFSIPDTFNYRVEDMQFVVDCFRHPRRALGGDTMVSFLRADARHTLNHPENPVRADNFYAVLQLALAAMGIYPQTSSAAAPTTSSTTPASVASGSPVLVGGAAAPVLPVSGSFTVTATRPARQDPAGNWNETAARVVAGLTLGALRVFSASRTASPASTPAVQVSLVAAETPGVHLPTTGHYLSVYPEILETDGFPFMLTRHTLGSALREQIIRSRVTPPAPPTALVKMTLAQAIEGYRNRFVDPSWEVFLSQAEPVSLIPAEPSGEVTLLEAVRNELTVIRPLPPPEAAGAVHLSQLSTTTVLARTRTALADTWADVVETPNARDLTWAEYIPEPLHPAIEPVASSAPEPYYVDAAEPVTLELPTQPIAASELPTVELPTAEIPTTEIPASALDGLQTSRVIPTGAVPSTAPTASPSGAHPVVADAAPANTSGSGVNAGNAEARVARAIARIEDIIREERPDIERLAKNFKRFREAVETSNVERGGTEDMQVAALRRSLRRILMPVFEEGRDHLRATERQDCLRALDSYHAARQRAEANRRNDDHDDNDNQGPPATGGGSMASWMPAASGVTGASVRPQAASAREAAFSWTTGSAQYAEGFWNDDWRAPMLPPTTPTSTGVRVPLRDPAALRDNDASSILLLSTGGIRNGDERPFHRPLLPNTPRDSVWDFLPSGVPLALRTVTTSFFKGAFTALRLSTIR